MYCSHHNFTNLLPYLPLRLSTYSNTISGVRYFSITHNTLRAHVDIRFIYNSQTRLCTPCDAKWIPPHKYDSCDVISDVMTDNQHSDVMSVIYNGGDVTVCMATS